MSTNPIDCNSLPEARIDIRPWVYVNSPNLGIDEMDEQTQQTIKEFMAAPTVEIYYDLNPQTDYRMPYQLDGVNKVAIVSDCVTINGFRWHLLPGKNLIPRPVYEYLMSIPDMRKCVIQPGVSRNLGLFK